MMMQGKPLEVAYNVVSSSVSFNQLEGMLSATLVQQTSCTTILFAPKL